MRRRKESDTELDDDAPSKTQIKKAMHELQDLGSALLELPEARLEMVEMDERLRDAIDEYRRIRGFEARRRQEKYIGKLLRHADPEPLRRAVEEHSLHRRHSAQQQEEIELWRDRLLADDAALAEWTQAHPDSDTRQFRALIRDARREQEAARIAAAGGAPTRKGRCYRELFQKVRSVLQETNEHDSSREDGGAS